MKLGKYNETKDGQIHSLSSLEMTTAIFFSLIL